MAQFADERRKHSRFYAHFSGVAGAASLLSLFKDFVEWRSFLLGFIDWWQAYVRPAAHFLFWWIPDLWPWPWPDWGYDYIVFSIIFGFGGVRFFQIFMPVHEFSFDNFSLFADGSPKIVRMRRKIDRRSILRLAYVFFITSLFWPVFLLGLLIFAILTTINDGFSQPMREALFLALSPFIYFIMVLFINYGLMFAGVD